LINLLQNNLSAKLKWPFSSLWIVENVIIQNYEAEGRCPGDTVSCWDFLATPKLQTEHKDLLPLSQLPAYLSAIPQSPKKKRKHKSIMMNGYILLCG
jgi:hypothetical protein